MFLFLQPNIASAAGTPCSITPVLTEADLNSCITEAPTDNSEFVITIGADFNITAVKNIVAGNNITLTSTNPASPATLTRDPGFAGRIFSINITSPNIAVLTIDSVIIDGGNQTAAANNQIIYATGTGNATVNLTGNTILRNNNSTSNGGAIMIDSPSRNHTLNISGNVQITNNSAGAGGGVYSAGVFTMSGGTISGNTVTGSGGGVVLAANSIFTMSGGTISGNDALSSGGGIRINTGATFTMTGGEISDNFTINSSGGVTVYGSTFNMSGGRISGNKVDGGAGVGSGGGVYVTSSGTFNMSGGEISDNSVNSYGGGVRVLIGSTFNMIGGKISGNVASNGGGIYIGLVEDFVTIAGGEISGNVARVDGGGIWVAHEDLVDLKIGAGVVFSGNSATVATRMNPADQALYDAQILATSFSLPLPFNGYNNYDVSYTSDLSTDICQRNSSLWADDTKCVAVPSTGLFGGQVGGVIVSVASLVASGVVIAGVWVGRKLATGRR